MSHEFTVTDSELLVEAPILALRRDTVTMPGGREAKREIVEHFGAVAVVALDGDGRVAMVEQYRHSVGKRLLELPAGILDEADEPELECARRELREEAGLEAARWEVLVDLVTSPGFADEAVRVFLARGLTEVQRPEAEDEEADMSLEWILLDDARRAVLEGRIVNSIAASGLLAASAVSAGCATTRGTDEPFEYRPTKLADRRKARGLSGDLKKI
ncbi:NUDIX domain-containing protein [Corynebacterium sp. UBA2622]|uniref:NUDIX domain-containing protein n=1 Tax=Corynebacterium sp. UBA2622 TaxID=1946393 RepID=UPI0025BB45EC|nr:NUDIX hydrolase [Corynebacterium sp. UBA2622]